MGAGVISETGLSVRQNVVVVPKQGPDCVTTLLQSMVGQTVMGRLLRLNHVTHNVAQVIF